MRLKSQNGDTFSTSDEYNFMKKPKKVTKLKITGSFEDVLKVAVSNNPRPIPKKKK